MSCLGAKARESEALAGDTRYVFSHSLISISRVKLDATVGQPRLHAVCVPTLTNGVGHHRVMSHRLRFQAFLPTILYVFSIHIRLLICTTSLIFDRLHGANRSPRKILLIIIYSFPRFLCRRQQCCVSAEDRTVIGMIAGDTSIAKCFGAPHVGVGDTSQNSAAVRFTLAASGLL